MKDWCFLLNIGNQARMPTLTVLFNIVLEALARAVSQEKEIKGIQIRKVKIKLSPSVNDLII